MKSYTDMLFLSTFSSEYQLDPSEVYRRVNQPARSSTAPTLSQSQSLACVIPCRRLACILVGVPHLDCYFNVSLPLRSPRFSWLLRYPNAVTRRIAPGVPAAVPNPICSVLNCQRLPTWR